MRDASYFFYGLLVQLPSIFTALICTIVALVRWKRHPKTSLLVILGLLFLVAQSLIFEAVDFFVPVWLEDNGKTESLGTFYTVTGVSYNILEALALALLLWAIFGRRTRAGAEVLSA